MAAVCVGFLAGHGSWAARLTDTWWYMPAAGLLLGIGLYGSTHEIERGEVVRDLRTVAVVITLGVLLKAAFIAGVMVLVFRKPEYIVLGIAVAQIDPLSVAAAGGNTRMSPRAKSLLNVWAAFDDPMTVLLSVYFPLLARHLAAGHTAPALASQGGGVLGYAESIGLNVLLCAAAFAAWHAVRRGWTALRRVPPTRADLPPAPSGTARADTASRVAGISALVVVVPLLVVAAARMLMPAVAVTGLLVRADRYRAGIRSAVTVAFLIAAFGLGVLLVGNVSPATGIVLGLAAFAAQAVVTLVVVPLTLPDLPRSDTIGLAISQQNGITAIILALALEPDFPGTVGIVGPAILTIGVLYYAANAVYASHLRTVGAPAGRGRRRTGPGGREAEDLPHPREELDPEVDRGGIR